MLDFRGTGDFDKYYLAAEFELPGESGTGKTTSVDRGNRRILSGIWACADEDINVRGALMDEHLTRNAHIYGKCTRYIS